jgi:hypothetical protein
MHDNRLKTAINYIQQKQSHLHGLLEKLRELNYLNQKVSGFLDVNIRNRCQVASLQQQRLTLLVDNGAVATRLRYLTPDLLKRFQQDIVLKKVLEITCKVRHDPHKNRFEEEPTAPKRQMNLLSPETATLVEESASNLQDPKLREIMLRIASHRRK